MPPSSYVGSIKSSKTETLISNDSRTMSPHTTTDVIIILVIFLVLIISLSVLAWRRPTSLRSPRALPIHGAALPASNVTAPVATYGGSLPYLMRLRGTLFMIYHWWIRAPHNRIDRIPSIMISHYEYTVARAPSVRTPPMYITRLPTPTPTTTTTTTTIAATSLSDASTINNEAMELRELDKGPSTSSVLETDDVDITNIQHVVTAGEPIARIRVDPLSAHEPPLSTNPMVEIDVAAVD